MVSAVCLAWFTYLSLWFAFTCVDVARDQKAGKL